MLSICFTLDFHETERRGHKPDNRSKKLGKTKPEPSLSGSSSSLTHQKRNRETPAETFSTLEHPCCQGLETGCHDSHSTTAASSCVRSLPLERQHRQNLLSVVRGSLWHSLCPPRFWDAVRNTLSLHHSSCLLSPAQGQVTLDHHSQEDKWCSARRQRGAKCR